MRYLNFINNYDKRPSIIIDKYHDEVYKNYDSIINLLNRQSFRVLALEIYPNVRLNSVRKIIKGINPDHVIHLDEYVKENLYQQFQYNLTDDRVFGVYSHHTIADYYEKEIIEKLNEKIKNLKGTVVVYGFGANLIDSDIYIQTSITRWEIQLRYRQGEGNFLTNQNESDRLIKYKYGYFLEWRIADRIKTATIDRVDYIIDLNLDEEPIMISSRAYKFALEEALRRPFRLVPYFDPGVWGGDWMMEVCDLDRSKPNFAWSFDGVPEENSLIFDFGSNKIELPAQDLLLFYAKELLGERVHARFGKKFPIRYDFLDTMNGGNLSLQVHPQADYIFEKFGMYYTQDESYYILDAKENSIVYLGLKEGISKSDFINDLKQAQLTNQFNDKKYINTIPVKKHDHILIPSGTIHCSAKDTMVLEISSCVYIFTFKLWDWARVDLDGRPRPIHLEHGIPNINFSRDTSWVNQNLVNKFTNIEPGVIRTGLHEFEFLETYRYQFDHNGIICKTYDSVNMANLVDGRVAIIESLDGSFEPFEVSYVETFIIPSGIKEFKIRAKYEDELCMILKTHVR